MVYEETLEKNVFEIKSDRCHAQILLKMTDSSRSDAAERIINELGIHVIEKSDLSNCWVRFKLDVKDMRNVSLKLAEHGFVIKGINALPEEGFRSNPE